MSANATTLSYAQVAHTSARRTRIRVPKSDHRRETMERMRGALEKQPGVTGVEINHDTGSVLVHHDTGAFQGDGGGGGLGAVLRDVGIIVGGLGESEDVTMGAPSEASKRVEAALSDLNARVAKATGGKVDVKLLVPASFAGIALWRFLVSPATFFGEVPGYVLAWYAFDSYNKLHFPVRVGAASTPEDQRDAEG